MSTTALCLIGAVTCFAISAFYMARVVRLRQESRRRGELLRRLVTQLSVDRKEEG